MPRDPGDRPTEHLPPTAPIARETVVAREPAVAAEVVDPLWAERLEDQVRSLKGLVALLAVLALAGIGLGLYALLGEDDDRRGASPERVERLNGRVDRLESRLGATTNEAEVARLEDRLDAKADTQSLDELTSEVQQLQASVEEASAGGDTSAEAVAQLDDRVDQLSDQVQLLAGESGQ